MSQLYPPTWDLWTNKSPSPAASSNPWISKIPSSLSTVWTPPSNELVLVGHVQLLSRAQGPQSSSSASICGVCRRPSCQLRSHRAYLLTRHKRSQSSILDLGEVGNTHPGHAVKPKVVDDLVIRTAFTKSYAFIEPSDLSVLQPSSFRLDVFHDLPVSYGDQPEMHKLIWHFLNNHLSVLFNDQVCEPDQRERLQGACLAAALSDSNVCLCLLATEKAIQKLLPDTNQVQEVLTSTHWFQRCLDFIQHQQIDVMSVKRVSESIISLCLHLILDIQGSKKRWDQQSPVNHHQHHHYYSVDSPTYSTEMVAFSNGVT